MRVNGYIIVLLVLVVFQSASCFEKPGEGAKAERGYKTAAPVIEALHKYYKANAIYPDSLSQLVPVYVPVIGREPELSYSSISLGKDYELKFSYTGPGVNHCTYIGSKKKWECDGYY